MCEKYNGWSNYETWLFNLWFDNSFDDDAADFLSRAEPVYSWQTKKDVAISDLEDYMNQYIEDEILPDSASFASDLIGAALSRIDFREIATSIIDNIEEDIEEEDEEDQDEDLT